MMNTETVQKLAEYFTGPSVVFHSVGLQIGGDRGVAANAFYAARNALNVTGYMTASEAAPAITDALNGETK